MCQRVRFFLLFLQDKCWGMKVKQIKKIIFFIKVLAIEEKCYQGVGDEISGGGGGLVVQV